jgi:molybdate transport system permease protein
MRNTGTKRHPATIRVLAYGWMAWLLLPFVVLFGGFLANLNLVGTIFADPRFWAAFWISLASAFLCAIIAGVFAIPAAYALAFGNGQDTTILETLMIDVPQTLPPVAVGVIYLFAFGPNSPWNLAFTFAAVLIAKLVIASPFVLSHALRRFRAIRETKLDLIARSLGANTSDVIFRVLLPMSKRELTAGLTLTWARAMGEFGGTLIFAGVIAYRTEILPTYANRLSQQNPMLALIASTVMVLFALLALVTVKKLVAKKS